MHQQGKCKYTFSLLLLSGLQATQCNPWKSGPLNKYTAESQQKETKKHTINLFLCSESYPLPLASEYGDCTSPQQLHTQSLQGGSVFQAVPHTEHFSSADSS